MIGKLTGILGDKAPPQVLVECGGVGYEVFVPMSTFYNLPARGEPVSLLTHLVVREDAHILYGFETPAERESFRQLIKISGVGPRTALAVLSGMTVADLAQAVTVQESGSPTAYSWVGFSLRDAWTLVFNERPPAGALITITWERDPSP